MASKNYFETDKCDFCGVLGERDPYSAKNLDDPNQVFNLGKGITTSDHEEAYSWFLERDFKNVSFQDGEQCKVLFAPPIHRNKRSDLQDWAEERERQLLELEPNVTNELEKEKNEGILTKKIKSSLKGKNMTVLFGWRRGWCQLLPKPQRGHGEEFDFLILDGQSHRIIAIEAKGGKKIGKAGTQSKHQQEYIREHHGHVLKGWTMVSCMGSSKKLRHCDKCKHYILQIEESLDFKSWWEDLQVAIGEGGKGEPNSYKKIVGRLLGLSATAKAFSHNLAKCFQQIKIDATGTEDNISASMPLNTTVAEFPLKKDKTGVAKTCFFLTQEQREIIYGSDSDLVLFVGPSGVGKTLLLKFKAMQLALSNPEAKILYVLKEGKNTYYDTSFFIELTKGDFKSDFQNITVRSYESVGDNEMVEEHQKCTHIFIDESKMDDFLSLKECQKKKGVKICVVVQSAITDDGQNFESFSNFNVINLKENLRNSNEIQKFVEYFFSNQKPMDNIKLDKNKLPNVILCEKDQHLEALSKALQKYVNGPFPVLVMGDVTYPKSFRIPEGWTMLHTEDYHNLSPEEDKKIFVTSKSKVDHGIEATVLVYFLYSERVSFSEGGLVSILKCALLRAISHLTVICIGDISLENVKNLANIVKLSPSDDETKRKYSQLVSVINKSPDLPSLAKIQNSLNITNFNLFVHQAAKDEHLDVVKFLIKECEVDVNQTDDVGYTPLQLAAKKGHINVVKCLTNHGADVNPKDDKYGCSALHHASFKGYTIIVKWLVQQCGADVNSKENLYGWTPLLFASSNNHLELVKFLVRECRPDINITEKDLGNTPLINSCKKGHLEVVKCLVKDGGADVNLKNNTKKTPLDIAQLSGKMEIVRYLQNCKDALGQRQSSAIGSFSNGDHYGDFFSNETDEIKCQLKAMGEDVHLKNYNGETILHKASFIGRFEIVKFLIEDCKALVNVMTFAGRRTPLHFAAFGGHLNVVKFLVNESEANVNQKDGKKGRTPLHYASKKGHLEVVKCLVNDGGADVNLKDANDNTSLRLAYLNNHIGVVIFLYD